MGEVYVTLYSCLCNAPLKACITRIIPIAKIHNKTSKPDFQPLFPSTKARDPQSKAEIRPDLDKCKQQLTLQVKLPPSENPSRNKGPNLNKFNCRFFTKCYFLILPSFVDAWWLIAGSWVWTCCFWSVFTARKLNNQEKLYLAHLLQSCICPSILIPFISPPPHFKQSLPSAYLWKAILVLYLSVLKCHCPLLILSKSVNS